MNPDQAYLELVRLSRDETLLSSCLDVLEWDEEVCMPRGGVEHRAEQIALLAGLVHDRATDPRYDELLSIVEASSLVSDRESPQAVNVRELRRGFDRERRMPRRLVEESARVTALASQRWAEARERETQLSLPGSIRSRTARERRCRRYLENGRAPSTTTPADDRPLSGAVPAPPAELVPLRTRCATSRCRRPEMSYAPSSPRSPTLLAEGERRRGFRPACGVRRSGSIRFVLVGPGDIRIA